MMKGHQGISNDRNFRVSPLAILWLGRMGLIETWDII